MIKKNYGHDNLADYDDLDDANGADYRGLVAVLYDPLFHGGNAALLSHRTKTSL